MAVGFRFRGMKSITPFIAGILILFVGACATQQPLKSDIYGREVAETYLNQGVAYAQKGDYGKAIDHYTKALEADPGFRVAYLNRAFACSKLGEYDKAISDYNMAIEIFPRYAIAYNNRGYVYRKKGDFEKAISDYSKAVEIDKKYAVAYYNRGSLYYYQKQYDRALEDIQKARSLGYSVSPGFLKALLEASTRQR